MKQKLILVLFSICGYVAANAGTKLHNGPGEGKKDELNGTIVHAETKRPVEGVVVTAVLAAKKEKAVISNEDGSFVFDELKPGIYKFIFEKIGFKKISKEKIIVKTDETFQLKIEMIEVDEYDIMPSPFNIGGF